MNNYYFLEFEETINHLENGMYKEGNIYVDYFSGADNQRWSFEWLYNL